MKKCLFVIGTRPEAIKLYSPIHHCRQISQVQIEVCATNQHQDLLPQFLRSFEIPIDYEIPPFQAPTIQKSLSHLFEAVSAVIERACPDLVVVQGDTTSAFAGALSAHYWKVPVAHIEAGLRSGALFSPWPEEANRRLIDQLSSYFFVPTREAQRTLKKEGVAQDRIWVVGNTSIDALMLLKQQIHVDSKRSKRSIVVTIHRRENHGKPLGEIARALKQVAQQEPDVEILFFLHPNPAVHQEMEGLLGGVSGIHLCKPRDYLSFIEAMLHSTFILTDSGGIQEEAPYLGKPVLIVRKTTERPEGITRGTARLVKADSNQIAGHCLELLRNQRVLEAMSQPHTPYGLGDSGEQIAKVIQQVLT